MRRSHWLLVLCSFALAAELFVPRPAGAGVFHQSWSLSDWGMSNLLGNTDGDASIEILFLHKTGNYYGIVDQVTGAVEKEFPGLTQDNTNVTVGDLDGDERYELFFWSRLDAAPTMFRAYEWSGSDYVPFVTHSDPVFTFGWDKHRTAGAYEFWEASDEPGQPNCDFRLRDLSGNVVFRASTDVPGWTAPLGLFGWVDRNQDGIKELMLEDQTAIRALNQYSGSFTVSWVLVGWSQAIELGDLDDDAQPELLVTNNADGRYAIVDGLTGAIQQEFPTLQYPNAFIHAEDVSGDSRLELIARKITATAGLTIYQWNGASFAPSVTVPATDPSSNMTVGQLRGAGQFEIWEQAPTDFSLYDLSGALLFRASMNVPGWSVAPFSWTLALEDPDHDGINDMILSDDSHVWVVHYSGSFAPAWVANGWQFLEALGNVDADASSEFMLSSSADGRFAIVDGVTGQSQQEFPSFSLTTSTYFKLDTSGDGHPEFYFGRNPGETPLFTAYSWNGSTYAPTSSHAEAMGQWAPVQVRSGAEFEFLEVYTTDIQLRDLGGTVIFRASTHLPGWAGLPNPIGFPLPVIGGPRAFMVVDNAQVRAVLYDELSSGGDPEPTLAFRVFPNAPNPFRASTAFRITNPKAGDVGIRIFDASGRLVRKLDKKLAAGFHQVQWDGRDHSGQSVGSGVLFYEITADGSRQTGKLIRMR